MPRPTCPRLGTLRTDGPSVSSDLAASQPRPPAQGDRECLGRPPELWRTGLGSWHSDPGLRGAGWIWAAAAVGEAGAWAGDVPAAPRLPAAARACDTGPSGASGVWGRSVSRSRGSTEVKATLICCPLSEPSAVTRVVRGQPLPSLRVTATVSYPPAPRAGSHSPRGARLVVGPGGVQRGGCVWPGHSTGDPRPRAHTSEPHRVLAAGGAEAIGAGAGGLPRGDGRGGPPQDVLLRVSAITEDEPHAPGGGVPTLC